MTAHSVRSKSRSPARGAVPAALWVGVMLVLGAGPGLAQRGPADAPPRERLLERLRESGRVDEALVEAYRTSDRAPVVVVLDVPERRRVARAVRRTRIREQADRLMADCPPEDFRLRHRFRHVPDVAGELHLRAVLRLLRNPAVRSISLDGGGRGMLEEALPLVGGYTANTNGFVGAGTTIATLDSGVDTDHLDLAAAIVDEHCICNKFLSGAGGIPCCPNATSFQTGPGAAEDDHGHGTLVAGAALSRGVESSVGIAEAAGLVAVKVLGDDLTFDATSDIIAALQWVTDNYTAVPPATSTVRVVNMSLATSTLYLEDPIPGNGQADDCGDLATTVGLLGDAVDELESRGVLVVAAAGNGENIARLPAPACLSNVVSVGATWDANLGSESTPFGCTDFTTAADQITCFTNAPPHMSMVAPGARTQGPLLGGGLGISIGTSFSAPLVAGCGALLFAQSPSRTPAQVTGLLLASPTTVTDGVTGYSFPRLDCADALGLGPEDDDSDFDGIRVGDGDNCPLDRNPLQTDVDVDGPGDRCDVCVFVADPGQEDGDLDGLGDACECTGPLHWPGDVDQDGLVDTADFTTLSVNFESSGATLGQGDQNCDGVVDGADYTLWADHEGRSNTEADLP